MPSAVSVLLRAVKKFRSDGLSDWAAALTYYGVLALFPALLMLVSILGLVGDSAAQSVVDNVRAIAPAQVSDILASAVENLQDSQSSGIVMVVALAVALWSASGYIAAFMRASNVVWDAPEARPLQRKLPVRVGLTLLMVVLMSASIFAVVATGPIAQHIGSALGVADEVVDIWGIAKWPAVAIVVSVMISVLYWVAPNIAHPSFAWITPGGICAVALWVLASAAFGAYVANFGSYNETYGTLASAIVFLVWLWITNIVILFGAAINAEIHPRRNRRA